MSSDIPAYGPYANSKARAIAEVELLSREHAQERAALKAKHDAVEAARLREEAEERERAAARRQAENEQLTSRRATARRAFLERNPDASDAAFDRHWSRIRADELVAFRAEQRERLVGEMQGVARCSL